MTSAMMMNGAGYGGARTHNEAAEVEILRIGLPKIPQGLSPRSSACLYLRTQTSTPCAIFAKSLFSTFDWRYSINSRGRVIVIETLLRAMHILNVQTMLNMCNLNMSNAHSKCAGRPRYARTQPISGSYAGHPDNHQVRGPVRGGEDAADRISGAHRPGDAAEPLHPQAGAGVRVPHADRRVPRGIIPVRGGSGAIGDGREVAA